MNVSFHIYQVWSVCTEQFPVRRQASVESCQHNSEQVTWKSCVYLIFNSVFCQQTCTQRDDLYKVPFSNSGYRQRHALYTLLIRLLCMVQFVQRYYPYFYPCGKCLSKGMCVDNLVEDYKIVSQCLMASYVRDFRREKTRPFSLIK